MTPIEKALIDTVAELYVAVNDLHFHLSRESGNAGEEAPYDLRQRTDLLAPCGQTLKSVHSRLKQLGVQL